MRLVLIPVPFQRVRVRAALRAARFAGTAPVALAGALALAQTGASRTALAIVSDAKNRAIVDVGADDFVIQEAGQAREVLSVRVADYPVLVMLDTGADARADFGLMRKAVERFIDRLGPRPIALGTFGDAPRIVATFEDDRQKLREALQALEVQPAARSMLLQGAALGAETIRAAGALFSTLVLLSATPSDGSQRSADELVAEVVDSGTVLHVIANRSNQIVGQAGVVRSGQALRSIAEQTRGEYTVMYSPASYQPALDRLSDRLNTEMMVEYLVPAGSKPTDVKVGVRLTGVKVRGLGVAPR
jgi:hypothetical protein